MNTRSPFRRTGAACALLALALAGLFAVEAAAQDRRPAPKVRSIPFVSITKSNGQVRYFETNAIPLLFHKACFGWRMHVGGPDRGVSLVEVLQTSEPAKDIIAGPETEVSADKMRATTRMRERVVDGYMQRSWCIIPGDPPGTYSYHITIDGEPRGEFVFCALAMPDQNENIDPTELNCPNKFQGVEHRRPPAAAMPG